MGAMTESRSIADEDRVAAAAVDDLEIRPRRRWDWWIAGIAVFIIALYVVDGLINNPRWEWGVVGKYLFSPAVIQGVGQTVLLTVCAGAAGLVCGALIAAMRLSDNPVLRAVATFYIWVIRAVPALVLLLLIYFLSALLPATSLGLPFGGPTFVQVDTNALISQFTAAVIGLTMMEAAYIGEIYRGAILAVPTGQREAAKAIGMPPTLALRRIIAPQAVRVALPPLGNELITLFKNTSLVTVIGYTELLNTVQRVYTQTYQTFPLLIVACIWYLALTSLAMLGQARLEKRFGRGFDRRVHRTRAWVSGRRAR